MPHSLLREAHRSLLEYELFFLRSSFSKSLAVNTVRLLAVSRNSRQNTCSVDRLHVVDASFIISSEKTPPGICCLIVNLADQTQTSLKGAMSR